MYCELLAIFKLRNGRRLLKLLWFISDRQSLLKYIKDITQWWGRYLWVPRTISRSWFLWRKLRQRTLIEKSKCNRTSHKWPPLMSGLGDHLREVSLIAIWLMEEPIGILVRWSLKRGGRLQEVSLIAIWLTEEPIRILVRWSLAGGGRLQEVSLRAVWLMEEPIGIFVRWLGAQGGSTVISLRSTNLSPYRSSKRHRWCVPTQLPPVCLLLLVSHQTFVNLLLSAFSL